MRILLHLTLLQKSIIETVGYFGKRIREIRVKQNFLLRQLAAHIEAEIALISKSDRREQNINKEQFAKLLELLNAYIEEFVPHWLCNKATEDAGEGLFADQKIVYALTHQIKI